jgi:hypothetical protein
MCIIRIYGSIEHVPKSDAEAQIIIDNKENKNNNDRF